MSVWRSSSTETYSHLLSSGSIAANIREFSAAAHQHSVPAKQRFVRKRCGKSAKEIDRHFGNALLRGPHIPFVGRQAKLPAYGRLHACPVQQFALDLRSRYRLRTHRVHGNLFALFVTQVLDCTCELAPGDEELFLRQR